MHAQGSAQSLPTLSRRFKLTCGIQVCWALLQTATDGCQVFDPQYLYMTPPFPSPYTIGFELWMRIRTSGGQALRAGRAMHIQDGLDVRLRVVESWTSDA
jgi:hypothetical protein